MSPRRAYALVLAVGAALWACGGRIQTSPVDYGDDDYGPTRPLPPPSPSGPSWGPEPPTATGCENLASVSAADIDAELPWLPPLPVQAACTQQNIDDLKELFTKGDSVRFDEIKTTLGTTCAACAFSPMTGGQSWQVFVESGGGAIDNRTASCFSQIAGAACGHARFRWEECLQIACDEQLCGDSELAKCRSHAQQGACKTLQADYATACPNEADLVDTCGNIFASIAASCAGGADGGIDASAP